MVKNRSMESKVIIVCYYLRSSDKCLYAFLGRLSVNICHQWNLLRPLNFLLICQCYLTAPLTGFRTEHKNLEFFVIKNQTLVPCTFLPEEPKPEPNRFSLSFLADISCLVGLDHFNIIWSIGVEYMHCCLLGVEKRLLQLFLNSKYSDKDHYIVPAKRKLLNKRLLAITPTSSITRKPRPLTQLASFKASEYRSLLLYYLPICLPGCLPKKYVNHIRQFSAAVYILLKKRISYEEVNEAEQMLYSFVKRHQELFGKQAMVMVVHLLKHLAQSVRKLGPLWTHSAFPFERNNGCLLKLANGTTHVLHQISSKYCLKQALHDRDENDEYDVKILLGKVVIIKESATSVFDYSSMDIVNLANVSLSVYTRVKYKQIIYTSRMYTRPKRSIDYFIGLKNGVMGTAKYYFTYMDKVCVMLLEYEAIDTVNHINKVLPKNRLILASIDEIEKKYLFMKVGFDFYVTCRPNPYENE